jgi:amino acid transporter
MAVGFILFAIFAVIILFISILSIIILIICIKYILKHKRKEEYKVKNIKFIFSIFGAVISGIIIIFLLLNIVRIFVLPTEITHIIFKTNNEINEIPNITLIKQNIDGNGVYIRHYFFKEYHEIIPNIYNIKFFNISNNVKTIKLKSINLIINDDEQNILNNQDITIIENHDYNYNLKFDYESIENLIISYKIEIELKNGEIINNRLV